MAELSSVDAAVRISNPCSASELLRVEEVLTMPEMDGGEQSLGGWSAEGTFAL